MPTIFSLNTDIMKVYPFYLTTTGTYYQEDKRERPEGFPEYQFILTVEGRGKFRYGKNSIEANPGTLLFIPPSISHSYKRVTEKWITHWIAFDGNNINELFSTVLPSSIEYINIKPQSSIYNQLVEVNSLTFNNYKDNALRISSIIYNIIADFSYYFKLKDTTPKDSNKIRNVINYIEDHYDSDISLEELSEINSISCQYLCRVFKNEIGMRPFEYIQQFRINKAKSILLQNPEILIEDVAYKTGFNNPSYFGLVFKKSEGITPKEFLKLHNI